MRNVSINITYFVVFMMVSVSSYAALELKGSPEELYSFLQEPAPTVSIVGRAEDSAYSDIAKITLIISTQSRLLSEALTANSNLRDRITNGFLAVGIAAKNINTSKFSTSPQFGWFGDKPKSYDVVNRMRVEVRDEAHMKAVAEAADNNPEIEFAEIEFEHSQSKATKEALLQKAIEDVLKQKIFYEERLGLKLLATNFTAPNVNPVTGGVAPRAMLEEIVVTARKRGSYADDYESDAVTFDEVKYKAVVTVIFEIERP